MIISEFEAFALDHSKHKHCIVCSGCILDTRPEIMDASPLWCVGCREVVKRNLPQGARLPWDVEYS